MDPATRVIALLDGLSAASKVLGKSVHSIKRWRRPKECGGTGGFIPREHHFDVHRSLLKRGIQITADEIVYSPEQLSEISQLQKQIRNKPNSAETGGVDVSQSSPGTKGVSPRKSGGFTP